jgi:hypothetical protein
LSNTGTTGGMTFGLWQSVNRIITIGVNNHVNFQPGGTHSDSGYILKLLRQMINIIKYLNKKNHSLEWFFY